MGEPSSDTMVAQAGAEAIELTDAQAASAGISMETPATFPRRGRYAQNAAARDRASLATSIRDRLPAALVCLACLAVLGVGAWLEPAGKGMGTHTQLGLAPCGFLEHTGVPCATCGYTTSFTLAAHGRLWASFVNQPAAALGALLAAMFAMTTGYMAWVGLPLGAAWRKAMTPTSVLIAGGVVIAAWVYKIAMVLAR